MKGDAVMNMQEFERALGTEIRESGSWFTQPGPTESFRRTAPTHLLLDNRETAPAPAPDPRCFTTVGPTPSFTNVR